MFIRNAKLNDWDQIVSVYECARCFMREHGNTEQWRDMDKLKELLKQDICIQDLYVIEENMKIAACFALIKGNDPTYGYIENGKWMDASPYATIHRVASNQTIHGVMHFVVEYAMQQMNHLRIDTHPDNLIMQKCILQEGFQYCGDIYIADGTKRFAYERSNEWILMKSEDII